MHALLALAGKAITLAMSSKFWLGVFNAIVKGLTWFKNLAPIFDRLLKTILGLAKIIWTGSTSGSPWLNKVADIFVTAFKYGGTAMKTVAKKLLPSWLLMPAVDSTRVALWLVAIFGESVGMKKWSRYLAGALAILLTPFVHLDEFLYDQFTHVPDYRYMEAEPETELLVAMG